MWKATLHHKEFFLGVICNVLEIMLLIGGTMGRLMHLEQVSSPGNLRSVVLL